MIFIIFTNQNEAAYQKSDRFLVCKEEISKLSPERPPRKLRGQFLIPDLDLDDFKIIFTNPNEAAYQKSALNLVC
jgi:hypothetical protein